MKRTYVIVGTGGRSSMFFDAITQTFAERAELKGLCDINQTRMDYWNGQLTARDLAPVPTYLAHDFDRMIAELRPDVVVVTCIDRAHHFYICRAMELGCDVITEKPMTVDVEKCQQIIDTKKRTGRHVTVTFNYRYAPRATKVKEVLRSGVVGTIFSVHFEWLLDTSHGADYFRRWHRDKRNSGGLMVHKATHHFDLMNWWLEATPETVFAMGDLRFYGRENAEQRGVTEFYHRARGSAVAAKDPFALKVRDNDERFHGLYYNAEHEDGYERDLSVFESYISIEDTMGVMVRYDNKAIMTYSLNAHCPWEGFRVCFNGSKGRLEFNVVESAFTKGGDSGLAIPGMRELEGRKETLVPEILFQPHWGKPQVIDYDQSDLGGHGGGDSRMLRHIFEGVQDDPLGHAAGFVDGARSILTGIAANKAFATGLPVQVRSLVNLPEL